MAGNNWMRVAMIYAGVVTALLIFVAVTHARQKTETFDEITVHRINVTEPDGTLRLVISNRARLPGVMVQGKEGKPNRPYAGMIFYNDEQTENGGLIERAVDWPKGLLACPVACVAPCRGWQPRLCPRCSGVRAPPIPATRVTGCRHGKRAR